MRCSTDAARQPWDVVLWRRRYCGVPVRGAGTAPRSGRSYGRSCRLVPWCCGAAMSVPMGATSTPRRAGRSCGPTWRRPTRWCSPAARSPRIGYPRRRSSPSARSLDPFSPKSREVEPQIVRQALVHAGLLVVPPEPAPVGAFCRRDGSPGRVDRHADVLHSGPPPAPEVPLVVQVSRWDRMKDMTGVMVAFTEQVAPPTLRCASAAGRPGGHGCGRRPGRRAGPRRVRVAAWRA